MSFSVLMSVYKNDTSLNFLEAINSILINQSVVPDEVVVVVDGPVGGDLRKTIESYASNIVRIFWLKENLGLGKALAYGLDNCSNNLVARMDSDDISISERFEIQLSEFQLDPSLAVIGGQIMEFAETTEDIMGRRKVPTTHAAIKRRSRFRNPMNHMTVMFRKDYVLAVEGYKSMYFYEDYYLWLRLLAKGYRLKNVSQDLVFARAGANLVSRRRGLDNAKNEWNFYRMSRKENLLNPLTAIFLGVIRSVLRLMPLSVFAFLYSKFLRD
jgi:glycosyltransferase involved in cell wall biosynthesis